MRTWIYSLSLLCTSLSGWAQSLSMEVNLNPVGRDDVLTITYTFNAQRVNFTPSDNLSTDFHVLSGPNTMESTQILNGAMTTQTTWTYRVKAKSVGSVILEPATAVWNNKEYSSNAIVLEVTEESQRPNDPNSPEEYVKKLTFIEIKASKNTVYVGEPFSLRYNLFGLVVPSGSLEFLEKPTWDGFIRENVESSNPRSNREIVEYNGRQMYRWPLQTDVLVPLRAGTFQPSPLITKIPTPVQTRRSFFAESYDHIHSAKFPRITVLPLPEEGQPEDFQGAVGDFQFEVILSRNEVEANESITLQVKVKGTGNLSTIKLPKLSLPDQIEVFEPEPTSDIRVSAAGMRGSFSEEYILVPRYRGEYKIPPLSFSYFDPQKKEYVTLQTDEQIIMVSGEPVPVAVQSVEGGIQSATPLPQKQDVEYLSEDIRWIHEVNLDSEKRGAFWSSSWFVSGVGGSLLISMYLLFAGSIKRWNETRINPLSKATKKAEKDLRQASDWRALHLTLSQFLKDGFSIPYSDQIKEKLSKRLLERGLSQEKAEFPYKLLEMCEKGEYGHTSTNKDEIRSKMLNWIQSLKS